MNIEVRIDSRYKEPKIVVCTAEMTEELNGLIRRLSGDTARLLTGYALDGALEILDQKSLVRIYSGGGKVYAVSDKGEYLIRLRLYELEDLLGSDYVRISNSEIINLKKAVRFNLKLTGTISVTLQNGDVVYASRRYVEKIKKLLGV
ncbi:MAG: LytTR family DNA-binding domain-containing protein [Clostridia bacterium]|nr:LytTR family DNA-binding domain-containing protein [Clostridia bacterium]